MKSEKLSLFQDAIELTKLACGPVPAMPADTLDDKGNIILSAAQELYDRRVFRIFTEFYCGLFNAYNDETVFTSPAASQVSVSAPSPAAAPSGTVGQAIGQVAAAVTPAIAASVGASNPPAGAAVSAVGTALSAALSKPLGTTP